MNNANHHSYSGCGFLLIILLLLGGGAWWWRLFPFQRIGNRNYHAQLEVRNYVAVLNRAQQAYYLENKRFTTNITALDAGIDDETQLFRYQATVLSDWAIQHSGTSKQESLSFYGYTGLVWVVPESASPQTGTEGATLPDGSATAGNLVSQSLLCISDQRTSAPPPTFELPAPPITAETEIQCPKGYTKQS
ncbi:MAG: type IV pilin-like G/H family protein [Leptolyngbyaceae cyanobacterium]